MGLGVKFKVWITYNGSSIMGPGGRDLLMKIAEKGSISSASRELNLSYRFAWQYITRIEKVLGRDVILKKRGGRGGGGTYVEGKFIEIIKLYDEMEEKIREIASKYEEKMNEVLMG
jgi:molybdate transport system regulatory protein